MNNTYLSSLFRLVTATSVVLSSLLLGGCPTCVDEDGDSYCTVNTDPVLVDCDDTDADIKPGAEDVCDGVDNDCDLIVDNGLDADGDGYFGEDADLCTSGDDCDDTDSAINPGETESCDGEDNDCDGDIDEGLGDDYWADSDEDGYGDSGTVRGSCDGSIPEGYVAPGDEDCDDDNGASYPGATELCDGEDNDCDGAITDEEDADGDLVRLCDGDCDDADDAIYPGATELCDGIDNDCDSSVTAPGEVDGDGDTYLDCLDDCDDADPAVNPAATEACDGIDNDCDPATEPAAGADSDGDGDSVLACDGDCDDADAGVFPGNPETCSGEDEDCDPSTTAAGEVDGDGDSVLACDGDCDDANANNFPGNAEVCDGQDNDCNALTDDSTGSEADGDGDDYVACTSFVDHGVAGVSGGGDCDDSTDEVAPGNPEICDGLDNDCDGATTATGGEDDTDGDGSIACSDCDDGDATNFPGNTEVCDGQNNDCDDNTFAAGEGVDDDGDGVDACAECDDADPNNFPGNTEVCDLADNDCDDNTSAAGEEDDSDADGSVACLDCDDNEAQVFPGATEVCDGQLNDCDGELPADEVDGDSDTWLLCTPYVDNGVTGIAGGGDCDDALSGVNPNAVEVCDAIDNNCDAASDEGFDVDDDNATSCGADGLTGSLDDDCDDNDDTRYPGAPELCDGLVNDCHNPLPADEVDSDGDGALACAECDDNAPANYPGNPEICDGLDNDCNGTADFPAETADADLDGSITCADCDDADPANFPGNSEACDGGDNDCDNSTFVTGEDVDADGDGSRACDDCDESAPKVYPGAPEVCDGQLNDCDGTFDPLEGDADNDFYIVCSGFVNNGVIGVLGGGDCAPSDIGRNPGEAEVCDAIDQNCNGILDDGYDNDGDGVTTCGPNGVLGDVDDDCSDNVASNFPGANEVCDGSDNDCDGFVDAADADFNPLNVDNDGDGDNGPGCGGSDCNDINPAVNSFDDDGDGDSPCGADGIQGTADDDCDDDDPEVNRFAQEYCDGIDNDCDKDIDNDDATVDDDFDGDGYVEETYCGGNDCDDSDVHVFPGLEYTSGFVRQCLPAAYPGGAGDWHFGHVDDPAYFYDPTADLHYLYVRGHHSPTAQAIGYLESSDGVNWGDVSADSILELDPQGWDTAYMHSPSVVYAPSLAGIGPTARPFLLYYMTRSNASPQRWTTGLATATTATGPFERIGPDGTTVLTGPVLDFGADGAELDSFAAGHLWPMYDEETETLLGWYGGVSAATFEFTILHATSEDGMTWEKYDTALAGTPDPIIQMGAPGEWDQGLVRFPLVTENSDPLAGPDEPFEFFYNGSDTAVGRAVGTATVVGKNLNNPVLEAFSDATRFDGVWARRPATFLDAQNNTYHTYYGARTNDSGDVYGVAAGNPGGQARFIGQAVNYVPELSITSPADTAVVANPATIRGRLNDSAPDLMLISVVALTPGGEVDLGTPTMTAVDPGVFTDQTLTWVLSGVTLPADTTGILVEVEDEAGYVRSELVSISVL